MKKLIHSVLNRLGYHIVSNSILQDMVHVHHAGLAELDCFHVLREFIEPKQVQVCFDVGANVGQSALKFAEWFPNANIHSFEPVADTAGRLMAQTASIERIASHQIALGAENGRVTMHKHALSVMNSLVDGANRGGDTETVEVRTGDDFVAEHAIERIDFLKIDTEGYEIPVLDGFQQMLSANSIGWIYAECGFSPHDPWHTPMDVLYARLTAFRFRFQGLFEQAYLEDPFHLFYANALFAHEAICPDPWR